MSSGRFLTFGRQRLGFCEAQVLDILTPGAKPLMLVPNVTMSDESRFSKNEKWVAYASNQSGSDQTWVIPFPPTGEEWQISQTGGVQPRWSSDGNELFFLDPDGRLMAVSIPEGDPLRAWRTEAAVCHGPDTVERPGSARGGGRSLPAEAAALVARGGLVAHPGPRQLDHAVVRIKAPPSKRGAHSPRAQDPDAVRHLYSLGRVF
ncbi:MAG: hypothetical protein JJE39_00950 [Vicinamibacteria bacterium]|nr:hypothetical protein [Vicinamibacteria bacterium]